MNTLRHLRLIATTCALVCMLGACQKNAENHTEATPTQTSTAPQKVDYQVVLDVRTDQEFNSGHLDDALHIPVQVLETRLSELPEDKNTTIMVYCRSGSRSAAAKQILEKAGYTAVTNGGGYSALKDTYKSNKIPEEY